MEEQEKDRIAVELKRIEEDCTYSSKSQFNASDRLSRYHKIIGGCAVAVSAVAGTSIFADAPDVLSGGASLIVAVLTALLTFMKYAERATEHKSAGDQYLGLRNDLRRFREIRLPVAQDAEAAMDATDDFASRQKELNRSAPIPGNEDFQKARKGIEEGQATHAIDGEAK